MTQTDWIALAVIIAANFAAASTGALFKPGPWYEGLKKPVWTPPNWAFPVVWTVLYSLNAAAGFLVWRAAGWEAAGAFAVYGVSLLLNGGWSYLFFGLRRLDYGLVDVIALWISIAAVAVAFWPYSTLAAAFQAPYLLWVTTAAALNVRMLMLNGPRGLASGT